MCGLHLAFVGNREIGGHPPLNSQAHTTARCQHSQGAVTLLTPGICAIKQGLVCSSREGGLYQDWVKIPEFHSWGTVVILFSSVKTKSDCKKDWFCNGNFQPLLPFPLQVNAVICGISLEYGIWLHSWQCSGSFTTNLWKHIKSYLNL